MKSKNIAKKRGVATLIVIVMGVLFVIFLLAISYFFRVRETNFQVAQFLNGEMASFIAEGGINEAFAHVRRDSNIEGTFWFTEFRRTFPGCLNTASEEDFRPDKMLSLISKAYQPTPLIGVDIRFESISSFSEDPSPRPAEKFGVLRITATSVFNKVKRTVCTLRDVKVVNLDVPEPVANYKFYSLDLGRSLRIDAETLPRNLLPLVQSEKDIIKNWKFRWGDQNLENYPLCKRKTSYFFWGNHDFEFFTFRREPGSTKLYQQLGGLSILDEQPNFQNAEFRGNGGIFTRFSMTVDNVAIPRSSRMNFTVLGKKEMHILGHQNSFLNASVHAPDGEMHLEKGTLIRGRIFARKIYLKGLDGRLEYGRSIAAPEYHVEVSEQINLWKSL